MRVYPPASGRDVKRGRNCADNLRQVDRVHVYIEIRYTYPLWLLYSFCTLSQEKSLSFRDIRKLVRFTGRENYSSRV